MDLVVGARKVIVAMEHMDRDGSSKIVQVCDYPITGRSCVSLIVTDISVFEINKNGLILKEYAPGWTVEDIKNCTDANFQVSENVKEISF